MSKVKAALHEVKGELAAERAEEENYLRLVQDASSEAQAEDERDGYVKLPAKVKEVDYAEVDARMVQMVSDASDYVAALLWLMHAAGYSGGPRSLVLHVASYLDRNDKHEDGGEITDDELAEFSGCSTRTIQRWRRDLNKDSTYLHELENGQKIRLKRLEVLVITEGDYDRELEANRPTRYRFPFASDVAESVTEAREMSFYKEDHRAAVKLSAQRLYDSLHKVLLNAPAYSRRRAKKVPSTDSERKTILNSLRGQVKRLRKMEETRMKELRDAGTLALEWEALKKEMDALYYGATTLNSPQVADEAEVDPMGRQNVAPSVEACVVTLKDKEIVATREVSYIRRVPATGETEIVYGPGHDPGDLLKIPKFARAFRKSQAGNEASP